MIPPFLESPIIITNYCNIWAAHESTGKASLLPFARAPITFNMHWALKDKLLKVLESPKNIELMINKEMKKY